LAVAPPVSTFCSLRHGGLLLMRRAMPGPGDFVEAWR